MTLSPKARAWFINSVTAVSSLIIVLACLELAFRGIPKSHGVGYTLADKLWMKKYFKPTNPNGFRDDMIPPDTLEKKIVVVLGASIVAGYGMKDAEYRFSNLLRKKLSADARVLNFGVAGHDTLAQAELIGRFPRWPDSLILFYGPNDIEGRAAKEGLVFSGFTPYTDLSPLASYWVNRSYLLNYVYWLFPHGDMSGYLDHLSKAHSSPEIVKKHLSDLQFFVDRSRAENTSLHVVIFPAMWDRDGYGPHLKVVEDFFVGQGVSVLNAAEFTSSMPIRDLIMSVQNAHPSEKMNKIVFDRFWQLYGEVFAKKFGTR